MVIAVLAIDFNLNGVVVNITRRRSNDFDSVFTGATAELNMEAIPVGWQAGVETQFVVMQVQTQDGFQAGAIQPG